MFRIVLIFFRPLLERRHRLGVYLADSNLRHRNFSAPQSQTAIAGDAERQLS
jgi:hypothetical protein